LYSSPTMIEVIQSRSDKLGRACGT
jgi:hypothetical protein